MRISDWSSDVCSSDLIERGQKIAYVTDVGDTAANRSAIQALANDADTFFIEASFSAADRQQAAQRAHLTTTAAGEIARSANARRVEPFHFSPRYRGQEEQMMAEVRRAFDQEQEPAKASHRPTHRPEERRVRKE